MSGPGFRTAVVVRWSDMDAYGHLNHARTVTLLEEARVAVLFAPGQPLATLAAGVLVASLSVRYAGQLVHADSPLEVEMWVSRLRAADFDLSYELRPTGVGVDVAPSVAAVTQLVAFDMATQRPRRFSAAEKQALAMAQR
ncbi:thioesterase family protein [Rhodococcus aerolatus]